MAFDSEFLENLLNMEEGPTLDFKSEQYIFNKAAGIKATEYGKSELLKDILAFANTHRERIAYILIGVEEVKGGRSNVIGIKEHLEDAHLHEFINQKTNRPVEFNYLRFTFEGKEIGILSIPPQEGPVYVARKFGRVESDAVYVRGGSSTRRAPPDEIVEMGRGNPPKIVSWSIDRLSKMAKGAIVTTAQEWWGHPDRRVGYGLDWEPQNYKESCELICTIVDKRYITFAGFPVTVDSYDSLYWVFKRFEELASCCTETMETVRPALIDLGGLIRAITDMTRLVDFEKLVWEEFRVRMNGSDSILPREARYNLVTVASQTIRFVDVLEDQERYGDPEYDPDRKFRPPTFLRDRQWGQWRR